MSKIEVNTVDVQCGSTLTLGSSGKTVTLASGASQSGFGRTGTVDWCTTAKTSPFTAVSGDGFFVNTTSGGITVTLPSSPSAGDIVAFKDYGNTWDSNAVTLCRNGSKINGECNNADLNTESQSVTLIYVDGTKGWQDIHDSTANITGAPLFISATGGTIATCGDFKIHTFTSDGTFTVCTAPTPANNNVSYMVVAGGGAGGGQQGASSAGGGGGGAGGFREGETPAAPYTGSPLKNSSGLPVASSTTYPVTIGAGGAFWSAPYTSNCSSGNPGSNSIFSTITSTGGGGGGSRTPCSPQGYAGAKAGGSGGGAAGTACAQSAAAGNTPPVSPAQGTAGGTRSGSPGQAAAGGGGATVAGTNGSGASGGTGGAGATSSINGTPTARAGGGGGGDAGDSQAGGAGGGGASGTFNPGSDAGGPSESNGVAGTANTGGGGGGSAGSNGPYNNGGAGGSGVVIIRYKFQ
ncbi:hypothetical protein [uncultured Mediterranean phage uvMED]|nr:hypothetical protein [uncultured Mediterranean phage uvMED]